MFRRTGLALLLTVATLAATTAAPRAATAATSTPADAVVYVGQLAATAYTQTLDAVLTTQTQILETEEQIGSMADRIVYVTVTSQSGAIQVIYLVASLVYLGTQNGSYQYWAPLVPVAALPAGW